MATSAKVCTISGIKKKPKETKEVHETEFVWKFVYSFSKKVKIHIKRNRNLGDCLKGYL